MDFDNTLRLMECSYVDILKQLHESVSTDCIYEADKAKAISLIEELQAILWSYSA